MQFMSPLTKKLHIQCSSYALVRNNALILCWVTLTDPGGGSCSRVPVFDFLTAKPTYRFLQFIKFSLDCRLFIARSSE